MTDLELFARLIQCEAGGEGDNGMKAVASVVMNRVRTSVGESEAAVCRNHLKELGISPLFSAAYAFSRIPSSFRWFRQTAASDSPGCGEQAGSSSTARTDTRHGRRPFRGNCVDRLMKAPRSSVEQCVKRGLHLQIHYTRHSLYKTYVKMLELLTFSCYAGR